MMDTPNTLNSGMCRCCSSEGTFKDIKTKYHWMGEEEVYADMLTDCFDIKIEIPEGMDNGICEVCITQLRNAANFKKQVLHTEEQFKRRLQNKDIKNPIKLESLDDSVGSDHLSDPDYSGNEYEVPIKEEIEEKPKAKKRSVQATTSRAKKPKTEPESSSQQYRASRRKYVETSNEEGIVNLPSTLKTTRTAKPILRENCTNRITTYELKQHVENFRTILRWSNATPIRARGSLGYSCYYCNLEYPDAAILKQHTIDNHSYSDEPIRSIRAPSYFVKMDITALHCKICGFEFDQLDLLTDHLVEDHDESIHTDLRSLIVPFKFETELLRCADCDQEFFNFHMLLDHMRKHYRNFVCAVCNEGYLCYSSLQTHQQLHKKGEYPCEECDKVFSSSLKLSSHKRAVHMRIKRNKCGYCGEKFSELSWKLDHMEKVHGVKKPEYRCTVCDKLFTGLRTLSRHRRGFHLMERNHACPVCEMRFFKKDTLKEHMSVHSDERPFECAVCGKTFSRKSSLREHVRIHLNDRRYKCKHCGAAFIQRVSWRGHMRAKHGEEV